MANQQIKRLWRRRPEIEEAEFELLQSRVLARLMGPAGESDAATEEGRSSDEARDLPVPGAEVDASRAPDTTEAEAKADADETGRRDAVRPVRAGDDLRAPGRRGRGHGRARRRDCRRWVDDAECRRGRGPDPAVERRRRQVDARTGRSPNRRARPRRRHARTCRRVRRGHRDRKRWPSRSTAELEAVSGSAAVADVAAQARPTVLSKVVVTRRAPVGSATRGAPKPGPKPVRRSGVVRSGPRPDPVAATAQTPTEATQPADMAAPAPPRPRPTRPHPTAAAAVRRPVAAVAPYCPYCALLLDPPPESSRRCPRCRERIVVKRVDGRAIYLTEAAVLVFESERRRMAHAGRWTRERERWLKAGGGRRCAVRAGGEAGVAPLSEQVVAGLACALHDYGRPVVPDAPSASAAGSTPRGSSASTLRSCSRLAGVADPAARGRGPGPSRRRSRVSPRRRRDEPRGRARQPARAARSATRTMARRSGSPSELRSAAPPARGLPDGACAAATGSWPSATSRWCAATSAAEPGPRSSASGHGAESAGWRPRSCRATGSMPAAASRLSTSCIRRAGTSRRIRRSWRRLLVAGWSSPSRTAASGSR